MKLLPIMLLIAVSVTYLFSQTPTQTLPQRGIVQGIVTRDGTNDPIPDVQITVGVVGGPGIVTYTSPTGELFTMTPQNGQQLLDAAARGAARGLPQEILDAAQQAVRGNAPVGTTPPPPLTATTDSNGRFTISAVPAGNVTVRAELQGYFGPAVSGSYPAIVSTTATVAPDKPADVHLALIPGGTISGRVLDPAGKPLSETPVQALRRMYNNGTPTFGIVNLKSTDDHGEYRLYRMPPGEYFLLASPQRLPNAISNGASTSSEVPTSTFYPGAVDTSAALPIVLRGGDEITGINIPVKTATTSTISGRIIVSVPSDQVNTAVIQRGNVPAAIPSVMLARRERVGLDFGVGGGSSVFNPDDGTFVFRNVPSGSYVVVARLPVTANNGWGPGNAPERAGGPIAFGRTAVAVNGADVKDVSVVIHKGVDLKGILIVDGRPASANVRISLQSDDGENPALYRTARTDAQGHFIINTVPPGTYSLFAWESVLAGAWQSAEFLRTFADRGVPVSVSAAERANVNVGIIKERQ